MKQELEKLLQHLCETLKINLGEATGRSNKKDAEVVRLIFSYRAFRMGANFTDVADMINRQRAVVNRMADKYLDLLQYNSVFREKVLLVERGLKESA